MYIIYPKSYFIFYTRGRQPEALEPHVLYRAVLVAPWSILKSMKMEKDVVSISFLNEEKHDKHS